VKLLSSLEGRSLVMIRNSSGEQFQLLMQDIYPSVLSFLDSKVSTGERDSE
jgi:hypothetical protein